MNVSLRSAHFFLCSNRVHGRDIPCFSNLSTNNPPDNNSIYFDGISFQIHPIAHLSDNEFIPYGMRINRFLQDRHVGVHRLYHSGRVVFYAGCRYRRQNSPLIAPSPLNNTISRTIVPITGI